MSDAEARIPILGSVNRATIVIPQRGNERLTKVLIEGIWKHEGDDDILIAVVEDGGRNGADRPSSMIANWFFDNKKNGITAAWNLGIQSSENMSSTIILMNNDIICNGKFIDLCKPRSKYEIVGAKKRKEPLYGDRKLLQGWFLCFNRSLWEKLGGFDERFKLYFQDTDFQIRALKEGGSLRQVDLPLRHLGHKTAHNKKLCPDRGALLAADKVAFREKHGL